MEFSDVIVNRQSVRSFKPDPIDEETLLKVLEAARLAPTACNYQPFQLIVIRTQGRESELKKIYHLDWFTKAPIVIMACGIPSRGWVNSEGKNFTDIDVAIVMDHLILAATDAGLGTCWVAPDDPQAARKILNLPEGVEPIVLTPLGYPAGKPHTTRRKPLSELVRYEHW